MVTRDEVVPLTTDDATPLPANARGLVLGRAAPTADAVLNWILAADGRPWFPSRFAADNGIDRDSLDDPLNQLRLAGLIQVVTWVRGTGQGFAATPEGETAAADPTLLDQLVEPFVRPADLSEPRLGNLLPVTTPASANPTEELITDAEGRHLLLELRPPFVVPALLILNLVWFFVGVLVLLRWGLPVGGYLSGNDVVVLRKLGAVTGADLPNGQWWRLFASCFVHIGWLHLLGNLFALAMMGPLAELLWGRGRLLIIYFLSGLAGSCLAMANQPDSLLAGASGAIWGVLMSLAAWLLLFRTHLPDDVAADWGRRLALVLGLNAAVSFLPQVSWEAHLGGGVVGFVAAGLLNALRTGDRPRRILSLALLVSLPVVCIGGLMAVMKWGETWTAVRHRMTADRERAVAASFHRDAAPLIELAPEAVRPVEAAAVHLLIRPGPRRDPAVVLDVRERLIQLRGVADLAAAKLSGPPTGVDTIDRHREASLAFAEARSRSFGLLLDLLDADSIPDPAAWTAWGDSRRAADALWRDDRTK